MPETEIETAIEAFAAAGADRGLYYLSVPITTGLREYQLMRTLGASREQLRNDYRSRWRSEVVEANERDAASWAALFAQTVRDGRLVVNPARMERREWAQRDFDALWDRLIREAAVAIVVTPGWAYSRGARLEVQLAFDLGLPILSPIGQPVELSLVRSDIDRADQELANWGYAESASLPRISLHGAIAPPASDLTARQAEAEVFAWLVREREYQLQKFGVAADDARTASDGLDTDGWWWQQLTNYYHRASVLGVDSPNGRQALAKFVATGCGLLESVVRLHGTLPEPGRPSGDVGDGINHWGIAASSP